MITELKIGDYIEKSELDTEQKYNDVVAVFMDFNIGDETSYPELGESLWDGLLAIDCGLVSCKASHEEIKRKLTYNEIMSLKKVDVDNCNIDKVVSDEVIKPYDPRAILQSCKDKELESLSRFVTGDDELINKGELLKLRAATDGLIRLGYTWDDEEKAWCKIVKEYL